MAKKPADLNALRKKLIAARGNRARAAQMRDAGAATWTSAEQEVRNLEMEIRRAADELLG